GRPVAGLVGVDAQVVVGPEEGVEARRLGGQRQRQDLVVAGAVVRLEQDAHPHEAWAPSGKWQATEWPVASSLRGGCSSAHRCAARGQRVRNRQPLGGWTGEGGSPAMVVRVLAPAPGTESSSARV